MRKIGFALLARPLMPYFVKKNLQSLEWRIACNSRRIQSNRVLKKNGALLNKATFLRLRLKALQTTLVNGLVNRLQLMLPIQS